MFRRIVLPLSLPALATFAVFAFMASWNSFLWPLVIVSSAGPDDPAGRPVQPAGPYATAWNLVMAGATVASSRSSSSTLFAQRYVIRGVALSGLKG